jgi:hypothetical protein
MTTTRTARKAAPKAAPKAPKATAAPPQQVEDEGGLLGMVRSSLKGVEGAALGFTSLSTSVLSGVGLPESASSTIKSGTDQMVHGVTGSIGAIASGSMKVAGKGFSLVSGGIRF